MPAQQNRLHCAQLSRPCCGDESGSAQRTSQDKNNALDHVAGYALHNDYSERSFQLERGGQWVKGKSAGTFAPLGPFLATPDEISYVGNLKMWLMVKGTSRQNSSTANMIFDIATLVSYVSEFMTLVPGDCLRLTGRSLSPQ
jgi:2,4-diketo-3-deoxy-L-fuconate hydrolase